MLFGFWQLKTTVYALLLAAILGQELIRTCDRDYCYEPLAESRYHQNNQLDWQRFRDEAHDSHESLKHIADENLSDYRTEKYNEIRNRRIEIDSQRDLQLGARLQQDDFRRVETTASEDRPDNRQQREQNRSFDDSETKRTNSRLSNDRVERRDEIGELERQDMQSDIREIQRVNRREVSRQVANRKNRESQEVRQEISRPFDNSEMERTNSMLSDDRVDRREETRLDSQGPNARENTRRLDDRSDNAKQIQRRQRKQLIGKEDNQEESKRVRSELLTNVRHFNERESKEDESIRNNNEREDISRRSNEPHFRNRESVRDERRELSRIAGRQFDRREVNERSQGPNTREVIRLVDDKSDNDEQKQRRQSTKVTVKREDNLEESKQVRSELLTNDRHFNERVSELDESSRNGNARQDISRRFNEPRFSNQESVRDERREASRTVGRRFDRREVIEHSRPNAREITRRIEDRNDNAEQIQRRQSKQLIDTREDNQEESGRRSNEHRLSNRESVRDERRETSRTAGHQFDWREVNERSQGPNAREITRRVDDRSENTEQKQRRRSTKIIGQGVRSELLTNDRHFNKRESEQDESNRDTIERQDISRWSNEPRFSNRESVRDERRELSRTAGRQFDRREVNERSQGPNTGEAIRSADDKRDNDEQKQRRQSTKIIDKREDNQEEFKRVRSELLTNYRHFNERESEQDESIRNNNEREDFSRRSNEPRISIRQNIRDERLEAFRVLGRQLERRELNERSLGPKARKISRRIDNREYRTKLIANEMDARTLRQHREVNKRIQEHEDYEIINRFDERQSRDNINQLKDVYRLTDRRSNDVRKESTEMHKEIQQRRDENKHELEGRIEAIRQSNKPESERETNIYRRENLLRSDERDSKMERETLQRNADNQQDLHLEQHDADDAVNHIMRRSLEINSEWRHDIQQRQNEIRLDREERVVKTRNSMRRETIRHFEEREPQISNWQVEREPAHHHIQRKQEIEGNPAVNKRESNRFDEREYQQESRTDKQVDGRLGKCATIVASRAESLVFDSQRERETRQRREQHQENQLERKNIDRREIERRSEESGTQQLRTEKQRNEDGAKIVTRRINSQRERETQQRREENQLERINRVRRDVQRRSNEREIHDGHDSLRLEAEQFVSQRDAESEREGKRYDEREYHRERETLQRRTDKQQKVDERFDERVTIVTESRQSDRDQNREQDGIDENMNRQENREDLRRNEQNRENQYSRNDNKETNKAEIVRILSRESVLNNARHEYHFTKDELTQKQEILLKKGYIAMGQGLLLAFVIMKTLNANDGLKYKLPNKLLKAVGMIGF